MPEPPVPARAPLLVRCLKAFGAFWWDFLVSDTPELLLGVLVAIGLVALLVKASSLNAAAVAVFPVGVIVLLCGSVYQARRAKH
jgi:ascorbate-specific PTS system EIIC-type component UlaA